MIKSVAQTVLNYLPDAAYLKLKYRVRMGEKLNLKNPQTFAEKLQWLKLHDRKPEYTTMVDKAAVKDYIAEKIGPEYIIPTLGIWDRFEDIDFDALPEQFVLKCTHDSGGLVICRDKAKLDREAAKKKIEKSLKNNYYYHGREWPYKNVKPRILAEAYMADEKGRMVDYKFFCFHGKVDSVMVCLDRETGSPKFYFFDRNWQLKRYNIRGKEAPEGFTLPKPDNMDAMFDLAAELSQGIPFVRVDLYNRDGRIYFGEMTFFPQNGYDPNLLPQTHAEWGQKLILPEKNA